MLHVMDDARPSARFGEFEFDPQAGELRRAGETQRLQPQPARVLEILLRDADSVVTRETLKAEVWPETVVEFDQGLNYCIRQIRAALGESAESPRYVETLARRGYRFIAPVTWENPTVPVEVANEPRRFPFWVAIPLFAAAAIIVLVAMQAFNSSKPQANVRSPIRVGVLPLYEEGPRSSLTEDLVVALTNNGAQLDVLGPATTMPFDRDPRSHMEIGAELGVAYLVSGGIRAIDSGLFVQGVRVSDGAHIFAQIIPVDSVRHPDAIQSLADSLGRQLRRDRHPP